MALSSFHPSVRAWFAERLGEPTPPAARRVAGDSSRQEHAHRRAHRVGKDTGRIPVRDRRPSGERARPCRRNARPLRVAAEGARQRHPEEPGRSARRNSPARSRAARGAGRRPHRRHDAEGARFDAAQGASHPRHDARVALHPADERRRPADSQNDQDGDRRRDPLARARQARLASGALPRAARSARRADRSSASASRRPKSRSSDVAHFLVGVDRECVLVDAGHLRDARSGDRGAAVAALGRLLARSWEEIYERMPSSSASTERRSSS